jgi:hypothetical protein
MLKAIFIIDFLKLVKWQDCIFYIICNQEVRKSLLASII